MSAAHNFSQKRLEIESCLTASVVPLWRLRELSLTRGGLLTSSLRRRAWPKLSSVDRFAVEDERNAWMEETDTDDAKTTTTKTKTTHNNNNNNNNNNATRERKQLSDSDIAQVE